MRAGACATGRGFSLIELLVTIGVIAVLIGISLPVLAGARESARRARCLVNVREVVTAVNAFGASNASRLPENRTLTGPGKYVTWRERFAREGYITDADVWRCPAHESPGPRGEWGNVEDGAECVGDVASSYALNGHVLWRREKSERDAVRADTAILRPSHTILVAETNRAYADLRASDPIVANYYGDRPGAYAYWHSGRGVYGFQDGHAEVLGFLETGSPDCRWHNGRDLTDDPFVPQRGGEVAPHAHQDWEFLVPKVYLRD